MKMDYSIGLVLTRHGLSDNQARYMRHHLQELARLDAQVVLVVPVVHMHGHLKKAAGPAAHAETRAMLWPAILAKKDGLPSWLRIEVEDRGELADEMMLLCALDEVWCAPSKTRSKHERPVRVYGYSRVHAHHMRFKMLDHDVALPPHLMPSIDTHAQGMKKKPAIKGW